MSIRGKITLSILVLLVAAGVVWGAIFYNKNLKGIGPAISKPGQDITQLIPSTSNSSTSTNTTGLPLKLPAGFSISIFAKNLPGARVMAFDHEGNMWVSQASEGKISELIVENGKVKEQKVVLKNLNKPHGLVFDLVENDLLYIAEENKISDFRVGADGLPQKNNDLPSGGGHFTRTLGFGPDREFYVSVGSSCNVCNEKDERRASIYNLDTTGADFKKVATGLRNSVFFTWDKNGKMWATDMGRDYLGDNLPPDEINVIERGKDYGWPICYGQNIHDTNFDKNVYIRDPCTDKIPPHIELPAHSAPLGLAFVPSPPAGGWPKEYQNNLLVAFHGSWNRSVPTGYKIALIKLDDKGNYISMEDFISGWLAADGKTALGRPVDIIFDQSGKMYISDDKAGVIYLVTYK